MRSILARIVVVMGVLIVAAGCGSHDDQNAPLGSALFDPCKDIRDSAFTKAGFDPATKGHPVAEFPDRCTVSSSGGPGLILEHYANQGAAPTFDRELARQQSVPGNHVKQVSVNGRDAFTAPQVLGVFGSTASMGCDVNLRTKLGMLRINDSATSSSSDGCTEALAAATILEPAIGPDR
ncbi:hypothetical protein [Nocardia sp. NBC_00511]|uniref:hypothetical protein n=1 Tax=Nocardia sp. NBC_00511 TaxID=2903591 RepID=UPI0030DE2CA3